MAAYVPANLNELKERIISILNANPGVWSSSVSGQVGAFPSNSEITAACLEADSIVAVEGYFQSANDALANHFAIQSAPLGDRSNIPFHHGTLNKTEVSLSVNTFTAGASNVLTTPSPHGLTTAQLVSAITTGALPTGIAAMTDYYVIPLTATTLKLAASVALAYAGTAISVTNGSGSGTNSLIAWRIGVEAANLDDITNAVQGGSAYVGSGAFDFLYKEDSGVIFTTARYARVTYPEYIKTADLQCNENEKTLLMCQAIKILTKNASPAPFAVYANEADRGMQVLVQDGLYTSQLTKQDLP